jgi:hypothetical protein
LATVPGPDAVDSGSNERGAAELRFQRLERVREQRRSRRRRRLILTSVLVLAMAGVCALGFTAFYRMSLERPGAARAHVPVGAVTLPVAPPPAVPAAPALLGPPITNAPTSAPSPTPTEGAKADAAVPRRAHPEPPPARDVTPPTNRVIGAPAPPRGEPTSSEPGDGTAAIDWLLKTSRTKDR